MKTVINIANDFTPFVGGRYIEDGLGNATEFRQKFLVPLFERKYQIVIELDGVAGYPASFIDEAFGGLIRENHFTPEFVLDHIEIKSLNIGYEVTKELIEDHIKKPDEITWK